MDGRDDVVGASPRIATVDDSVDDDIKRPAYLFIEEVANLDIAVYFLYIGIKGLLQ